MRPERNLKKVSNKFYEYRKRIAFMGLKRVIQFIIFQRIFRVNSETPWPVHWSSTVSEPKKIKLKNWLSYPGYIVYPGYSIGNYIQAINGIEFGVNVRIGPGVKIVSANHDTNNYDKWPKAKPIQIGDHVWLGANSVILPGVSLGPHTIVAAGAVVTKSFEEGNCVLAGVPAKVSKRLPNYDTKV
jgi:acetyltransferase-like isoleucine patch superfamily enzyme